MNKLGFISLCVAVLCLPLTACEAPQTHLTEDDISPIDYNKMAAFNTWLEEQKKGEPSNAFKAKPMQVAGKGRVRAIPDIAVITGLIMTEADQDDTAIDEAAIIINAVQETVKTQDVELNFTQIRTSEKRDTDCLARNDKSLARHYAIIGDNNYNANIKRQLERGVDIKVKPRKPQKRLDSELCPVTHIEAKLGFTARVKPAGEAGNIINDFTTAGVAKVDLFGYDFSDYDAHYKEASTKAVKDAKLKAERIAEIAGTTLSEIVSFRVDQPQRTTRFGPQAMIVTSHKNRNVTPGNYSFTDQVVTTGGYASPPPPPPPPPVAYSTCPDGSVVVPGHQCPVQAVSYTTSFTGASESYGRLPPGNALPGQSFTKINDGYGESWVPTSNVTANNALKMSLQAGQRTITVNAYLGYLYETPIDGSVVPDKVN